MDAAACRLLAAQGRYPAAGRELGAQDALPVWGALPSPAAVSQAGRGVPPSPGRSSLSWGWGWEGELLSLSSLFSWESGGLKESWLSGLRREVERFECAATRVEFSVGASGA